MKFEKTHKIFHKFIFFDEKPSKGGILSIILGALSVFLIILGIIISYNSGGSGGYAVGSLALIGAVLSAFGIYSGFKGLKEEERTYLSCKIGIILCACVVTFVIAIYAIGF